MATPPPFGPPDAPAAWALLNATQKSALDAFYTSNVHPSGSTAASLVSAGLIAACGSAYGLTPKGLQTVAWAYGAGHIL